VVLLCSCGVIVATTDIGFFTAVAAQFKVPGGFWWRHSLCGRVLKLAWKLFSKAWGYVAKGLRKVGGYIRDVFALLPVMWEWILAGGVLGLILVIICESSTSHWYTVFPMFLWCLVFAALVIYCGYSYGMIQKGIQRMKAGDLNEKIPTQWLFGSFKQIAEDLNALADVVTVAAEKQLKAERMKTELITNVSHDIKTPLTSVINYVDLLQQPHTEEEGEQYLEVLSRQSQRLKKLVEDLMDMSKASSGNVAVNITQLDAVETVNQALGEFADKLEAAQLTPVFRSPDSQLHMLADGRLTWRVLSNLLSNVVKYAMPGTRVYVDLSWEGRWVICSIKNISREELNISAEELTERFVRGDVSRNTEGSGLGLNIAQSLMRLQHGSMDLTVDGDLFKVTLIFPAE
jgi:signal transduction histidine kinase